MHLDLGDDFEALLQSRLHGHQAQLDRHRSNVVQKIDWLSPVRPNFSDQFETVSQPKVHVTPQRASSSSCGATSLRCTLAQSTSEPGSHQQTPRISDISNRLAAKRRADLGVADLTIEESLIAQSEYSKTLKWLSAQAHIKNEVPAKPSITQRASAIPSSTVGETTQRLYENHAHFNQRTLASLKVQLQSLVSENLEATFKPLITPRADQLRRRPNRTAHDDLYDQALRQQEYRRQLAVATEEENKLEMRSRTPKINRLSELIAERLPQSTEDRLQQRPKVMNESQIPVTPRKRPTVRTVELHQEHASRKAKIMALANEKELLTEGHTFAPQITSRAKTAGSHIPLTERLLMWEAKKQSKIEERREGERQDELSECTFAPLINHVEIPLSEQQGVLKASESLAYEIRADRPSPRAGDNEVLKMAMEALDRARNASKRINRE